MQFLGTWMLVGVLALCAALLIGVVVNVASALIDWLVRRFYE